MARSVILLSLIFILSACALPSYKSIQNDNYAFNDENIDVLSEYKVGELLNYQQQHYQLEDPLGDHALVVLLQLTASDVFWLTLSGEGYNDLIDDINKWRGDFEYTPIGLDRFHSLRETKPKTVDKKNRQTWSKDDDVFMNVILQEAREGIAPTLGRCHRWSAVYRDNPQTWTFPYLLFSKMFWALAYGDSSVYFVTEKEEQLAQWIVEQEIRSLSLDEVFRKSYQLNSGDVYLSLLTAVNVFSRFWYVNDRETLSIATRLKLISANKSGQEDNYGAWHHFWGMVLFGYCHGATSSRLVGWFESIGSDMVTAHNEADVDYINRYAGKAGVELKAKIENWPVN